MSCVVIAPVPTACRPVAALRPHRRCPSAGRQPFGSTVRPGQGQQAWRQGPPSTAAAAGASDSQQPEAEPPGSAGSSASSSGGSSTSSSSAGIPDALPVFSEGADWRTFRAQLVASSKGAAEPSAAAPADAPWAHNLPAPEKGCLLLANPLMFGTSQQYFYLSVILLVAHEEGGSMGLILNKPTEFRIRDLEAGSNNLRPEFDDCRLYLGGDVGPGETRLLHGLAGLPDSLDVLPGVYLGGFEAAKEGLAEGRYSPEQFRVLTRYAGWGPGQLEAECRRGVWLVVSANSHAILRRRVPQGLGGPVSVADVQHHERPSESDMWHYIARLAGGELAKLEREVRGEADPDIARAAGGTSSSAVREEPGAGDEAGSEGPHGSSGGGSSSSSSRGSGPRALPEGGGSGASDPSHLHRTQQARWQQHRRRAWRPEGDYRDGAGI